MEGIETFKQRAGRAIQLYDHTRLMFRLAGNVEGDFRTSAGFVCIGLQQALSDRREAANPANLLSAIARRRTAPVSAGPFSGASWCEVAAAMRLEVLRMLRGMIRIANGTTVGINLLNEADPLEGITRVDDLEPYRALMAEAAQQDILPEVNIAEVRSGVAIELEWCQREPAEAPKVAGAGDLLAVLQQVKRELSRWNTRSASELGEALEEIQPGHPLHSAVVALEGFHDGYLPRPAMGHWQKLLKATRTDYDGEMTDEAELHAGKLAEWVENEIAAATPLLQAESPKQQSHRIHHPAGEGERNRGNTTPGDAAAKILALLNLHHGYDGGNGGSCTNYTPLGARELARMVGVAPGSVSNFFTSKGIDHRRYKTLCANESIRHSLAKWNNDLTEEAVIGAFEADLRSQRDDD